MVLENVQMVLLVVVALLGLPAGFFLAYMTKEELKDGRKWFLALVISSMLGVFLSLFLASGENLALLLTTFVFIFFLAVVPLFRRM